MHAYNARSRLHRSRTNLCHHNIRRVAVSSPISKLYVRFLRPSWSLRFPTPMRSSIIESSEQLLNASCDYGTFDNEGERTKLSRPLFLSRKRIEDYTGKNRTTCNKKASELAELLTADLFGVGPGSVPNKLAKARHRLVRSGSAATLRFVEASVCAG